MKALCLATAMTIVLLVSVTIAFRFDPGKHRVRRSTILYLACLVALIVVWATTPAIAAFVTAVAWFGVFMLAHIFGWRAGRGNAQWLLTTYLVSLVATLATVVGLAAWTSSGFLLAIVLALMTSACLFVLYVP